MKKIENTATGSMDRPIKDVIIDECVAAEYTEEPKQEL